MKKMLAWLCLLGVSLGVFGVLAPNTPSATAQTGGTYDLTWNTIDGGGVTFSTGGTYSLGGTIGQPDAGALSGGSYTLLGGFWGVADTGSSLYLPTILR